MSKIILEAFKTDINTVANPSTLTRNILITKQIAYLKTVNNVPYIYVGTKKLNKLLSTVDGVNVETFTTLQQSERPDLNIQDIELTIIS